MRTPLFRRPLYIGDGWDSCPGIWGWARRWCGRCLGLDEVPSEPQCQAQCGGNHLQTDAQCHLEVDVVKAAADLVEVVGDGVERVGDVGQWRPVGGPLGCLSREGHET